MVEPKISIIVPVYNTSEYLGKCLNSIVSQTLSNIEIIIVNDCSPDPVDHDICLEYEKVDPRVIYIKHEINRGLGGARNSGLGIASGEYIWFIDSDDFIDINACEFLYNLANSEHVDVIAFSATSHINGSLNLASKKYYHYYRDMSILDRSLSGEDFIGIALVSQSFHVSACLHLFKRQLITTFRFRENVVHEDTDLIPVVIFCANSIFCTKYAPYYRLLREDSITQKDINEDTLMDKISYVESLLNYADKYRIFNKNSLMTYIHGEFLSVQNIYLKFEDKTKRTDAAFNALSSRYSSLPHEKLLPQGRAQYESYEHRYLSLMQELDAIKSSRLWKTAEYFRRIKNYF